MAARIGANLPVADRFSGLSPDWVSLARMVSTDMRQDFLGRWLTNPHPASGPATDHLGRAVAAGDEDFCGRALIFNSPAEWAGGHSYRADTFCTPTDDANDAVFVTTDAGSSGSDEPTWPTELGATVTDGEIVWQCVYAGSAHVGPLASKLRPARVSAAGTITPQ